MAKNIGVVGLGYVGLTLTAALARAGHTVYGVDVQPAVRESLTRGLPHIFEPGLEEVLTDMVGSTIFVGDELPSTGLDAAVICVGTPIDKATLEPNLSYLAASARDIARWCGPETLVVVRSTVPIGTSRKLVLPPLVEAWGRARLVMAPERTIQGQALRELVDLPQVIGGLDDESVAAGIEVFGELAKQVVPVSSLETAEMVKLANNCHTDLIYSFGNELALIAEGHRLDPLEVISATNLDYPRPDLCRPGYVGGGCLSKDPYIMVHSAGATTPFLVGRARELNEHMPLHVATTIVDRLAELRGSAEGARLAVLGWAYKGWPPTDDMRGTPISGMMPVFAEAGVTVFGHDPMVTDAVIRQYGGEPIDLADAFTDIDAVLLINDHPEYRTIDIGTVLGDARPLFIYDSWRILDEDAVLDAGVGYAGLGYVAAAAGSLA